MAEPRAQRRLAAIVAADMVGYSRLMEADEAGTLARLKAIREEVFDPKLSEHKGHVVKTMGDGLLIEFPSVVEAVQCAVEVQQAMAEREAGNPKDERIEFRIGINLGDVIIEDGDLFGDGVIIAARLQTLAEPGGVYVSRTVFNHVKNKVALGFEDLGERTVKNISEPVHVYALRVGPEAATPATSTVTTPALELPDKPSIAVLPFDNLSGDPEQEYFADGIAEDIITALSRYRWFFVIARNSSFTYKGKAVDVKQVARELGVRYVLEGSVRKAGKRVRIAAQLIDATTGRHIWAERYDRDLEDIFAVQDEITETIVGAVEPELGGVERERAKRKPPESLDAWQLYQRGMWHLYRLTNDDLAEARSLFRSAIDKDPTFARAYASRAYVDFLDVFWGRAASPSEMLIEGLEAAEQAIALEEMDAFPHFAMGRILTLLGRFDEAISELETAIELNPSFALAHYGLAMALHWSGRAADAIPECDEAIRLSPHDPVLWPFITLKAMACYQMREYEKCAEWARKAIRQRRAEFWPYAFLAAALAQLGRTEKARATVDHLLSRNPECSLAFFEQAVPHLDPDYIQHFLDGLRKAGLPE